MATPVGAPSQEKPMLTVGQAFPSYELTGVVSSDPETAFQTFRHDGFPGRWQVIFFWPMDFTFVCPTEIAAFGDLTGEFALNNAQLLGASTDSEYVHLAWRQSHPALKALPYPMLSDRKRELATALGILDAKAGVCLRATFIVDPQGTIRFASVNDLSVGRNPDEVLRVLAALQTGELCGVNWKKGEATLNAA
jgi:peroxiredoxin (alkyl hydroperoxide reductase subunit C)